MNKKVASKRRYKMIFLVFAAVISLCACGQSTRNNSNAVVRIDTIPGLSAFLKLSPEESKIDSFTQTQRQRFKDNRSRYELEHYKNRKMMDSTDPAYELLTIPWGGCFSVVKGDTLTIQMASGFLSGSGVSINLINSKLSGSFWIRVRHENVFKLEDQDTLKDNIDVPIIEQQLILDTPPPYKQGQQLTGYFTFKTQNYLRSSDIYAMEKQADADKVMDTLYSKGIIRFTCTVYSKEWTIGK